MELRNLRVQIFPMIIVILLSIFLIPGSLFSQGVPGGGSGGGSNSSDPNPSNFRKSILYQHVAGGPGSGSSEFHYTPSFTDTGSPHHSASVTANFADSEAVMTLEPGEEFEVTLSTTINSVPSTIVPYTSAPGGPGNPYGHVGIHFSFSDDLEILSGDDTGLILSGGESVSRTFNLKYLGTSTNDFVQIVVGSSGYPSSTSVTGTVQWCKDPGALRQTPQMAGNCLSCPDGGCGNGGKDDMGICPDDDTITDGPDMVVAPSTGAAGCSSCSGGGAASGMVNSFQLSHTFLASRIDDRTSLTAGWATNHVLAVRFFRLCLADSDLPNQYRCTITDPCSGATHEFLNLDGTSNFKPTKGNGFAPFQVLDPITQQPLSPTEMEDLTGALIVLNRKDGYQFTMYARDPNPNPLSDSDIFDCVLTEKKAPTGQKITIEYDPGHQFRIKRIADDYGVEAFPVYIDIGGRDVWDKVTIKGHDSNTGEFDVEYEYATGNSALGGPIGGGSGSDSLETVKRDGVELISYELMPIVPAGLDFEGDTMLTVEHKARFGRDRKTSLFFTSGYFAGTGATGNQFEGFVTGRADANSKTFSRIVPSVALPGAYVVEYDGQVMTWAPGQSLQYGNEPTFASVIDAANHLEEIRLGIPPQTCDETGLVYRRTYDDCGNTNRLTHLSDFKDENGILTQNPNSSYELTLYDDGAGVLPVYYRDRGGYVTKIERDIDGRVLRQITGLKDNDDSIDDQGFLVPAGAKPLQTIYGYVPTGSDGEGHVAWMASGPYVAGPIVTPPANERVDYEYHPSGLLKKVTQPLAAGQTSRSSVQYAWDGSRMTSMTNERGYVTNYLYDSLDRVISTDYAGGSNEQVWYDADNRRMYRKDRNGLVSKTTYDTAWRVQNHYSAYATADTLLNISNEAGMTKFTNLQQRTRYTYDVGRSQPKWTIRNESSRSLQYYDVRGRNYKTVRYPRLGAYRTTEHTYENNLLFSTRESFSGYTKRTYRGYSADRQMVRAVSTRTGAIFADNATILNLTRTAPAVINRSFEITDAVRDLRGNIVSMIDEYGTETFCEFDEHGRKTREIRGHGATYGNTALDLETTYEYDSEGRQFRMTDPAGVITETTYDDADNIVTTTVGVGAAQSLTTSYTYDVDGSRKTSTSPSGAVTTAFQDDCCGRSRGSRDGLGNGSIVNQDAGGRTIHSVGVENYDTHSGNLLNPVDNLTLSESTTRYFGSGQTQFRTRWKTALDVAIDHNGVVPIAGMNGVPATAGVTTQHLYDSRIGDGVGLDSATGLAAELLGGGSTNINIQAAIAKLAEPVADGGAEITFTSAYGGSASVAISPDELTMQVSISDGLGRNVISALMHGPKAAANDISTLIDWTCTQHEKHYTIPGSGFGKSEAVVRIDSDGNTTQSFTNGHGHNVGSMDQLGNITKQRNGPKGEARYVFDALGNRTRYNYDALGRQRVVFDPYDRKVSRTSFYANGRVSYRFDAKNKNSLAQYDDLGRVKRIRDRAGKWTNRTYDSAGRLATIKDAENRTTSYGYDILGRRTSTTLPDNSSRAMTYDAAGRVTRVDLPSGKSRTNVYRENATDVAGLMREVEYRDAANVETGTDTYSYDAYLRPVSTTSRYGVDTAMTYDNRGQVSSESTTYGGQTYTVNYGYDDRGRVDEIAYPSNRKVEYTLDNRSQLDSIKWEGSEIENRDYDDLGRLNSIDRPTVNESRTYFDDSRVETIGNTNVGTATYVWDDNGNKLSETWSGVMASHSFTTQKAGSAFPDGYDQEDRFMNFVQAGQSNDSTFTRSDIGNITNVNFNGNDTARSYSNVHELETIGSGSRTFDADGNMSHIQGLATLDWDEGGMLKSMVVHSTSFDGDIACGYDTYGRRSFKTSTLAQGTPETTVYIYAGPSCIAEYTEGAAPVSPKQEYVYADGIDSLVMLVRNSGAEKLGITRNQQWSVTSLVDSTGSVVERYSYDKFGKRTILTADGSTERTSSSYNMPYGYTSRRHEDETGLMYFRARYYDANTGEFISRDPLEYVDGMSLYRGYFAAHGGVDPSGLQRFIPTFRPTIRPGLRPGMRPGGRPATFPKGSNRPTVVPKPRPRPTPTPIPTPKPRPLPKPMPFPPAAPFPKCPKRKTCKERWGYEACPGPPAKTPRIAANEFLDGVETDPNNNFGNEFKASSCQELQAISPGSVCPNGGSTYHCKVIVFSFSGIVETDFEVSIFACKCCWKYHSGMYAKGAGTPHGQGAPHWASGTKAGGVNENGNPPDIFEPASPRRYH